MHIKKILLVNWCQHGRLELKLGAGLNGVIGSNGKGKSNFLDALRFAFTGESANPGGKSDNLRWGTKAGHVEVTAQIGDTDYKLKRWIKGSKVEMTWTDKTGGEQKIVKAAEMQEVITRLTGASPKVLLDAVFVPQGEIDAVLFQRTSERLKEFQRVFGLSGAGDAYRYLGEETNNYRLTPGLQEELKQTKDLLQSARGEFQANLEKADAIQSDIESKAGAEDVLKRHIDAERQQTALANAQSRVDAAAAKVADTNDAEGAAVTALDEFKTSGDSDALNAMRTELAHVQSAEGQWARAQGQREELARVREALINTPAVEPEQGQALEQALAQTNQAVEQARQMVMGNREPSPSEKAAQDGLHFAQADLNAHIQAGDGILSDPDVKAISEQIEHLRREMGGFESGVCPTCGQEVAGGPEAMAAKQAEAEKLGEERHQLCVRLQERFEAKKAELERAVADRQQAVTSIAQQAKTFFEGKYQEALVAQQAAQQAFEAARKQQDDHVRLASRATELQGMLEGVPETKPAAGAMDMLKSRIAALEQELNQKDLLKRACDRAQLDHEYALKDLDEAMKAQSALSAELDAPTAEEVVAAREDAEKVSQWRQSLGEINAAMASQKVAIETREREANRLTAQVRAEAQDAAWVETVRKVRDVLHPSKLPAMVMQEYAKIINGQVDWYLSKWQAPFKLWINDDLAFRAWKPDDEGNDAEMDAARLSGGEKIVGSVSFRLAMSDTFARQAGLVVLDEPSNYLDKANIQHLQEVLLQLRKLSATSHRQVIVVTHEQQLMGFFDHVVTIGDGGSLAA